ncbi:PepSY domain-containing protein [Aliikangiella maris]|uniref:PepSY-associated TM helix domain-containing protein n=2 Tax=Aliikangiella maris TaxID=3162458 RepID=A0ABV2BQ99_9GAMM
MTAATKLQKQKKRKSIFRKWHRRFGFLASLFIFNLAITGILLNHFEYFNLHQHYLSQSWLLDQYGVKPPASYQCFKHQQTTACQLDDFIYLNESYAFKSESALAGILSTGDYQVIITFNQMFWLNSSHQLVDNLNFQDELGAPADKVLIWRNQVIVQIEARSYLFDWDKFTWDILDSKTSEQLTQALSNANSPQHDRLANTEATGQVGSAQTSISLTMTQFANLQADYMSRQITLLQFVQDLHSGRLFNLSGKLVNDITAIILILLAISGFITWQRRKNIPRS